MESPITVESKHSYSAPPSSSTKRRRKSKPTRFEIDPEKQRAVSIVESEPSNQCVSSKKKKSATKGVKTPISPSTAMTQAEKFKSSLGNEFPSCTKTMVKSQVDSGFWMGLPLHFCKDYLPAEDALFVLEVENDQSKVKYIANKIGLSAGWKNFVLKHRLTEGDVLVFQLVETTKFKVYIFRNNDSGEVDGRLRLTNFEANTEDITPTQETVTPSPKLKKKKRSPSLSVTVVKKKHKMSALSSESVPPSQLNYQLIEHSGNNSEEVGSEVFEGSTPSETNASLEEFKTFEGFHIMVKGKCIDREFPDDVRNNYYKLCLCQKQFLHEGVRESMSFQLVVGLIFEIVSIANEIRNCKITTTKEEFENWVISLNSFETMGMKVGFLRDRIHKLESIVFKTEGALDIQKYVEAVNRHKQVEDEIKKVASKLKELKGTAKKFERDSDCLKQKADAYENKFKEEVDAPW